MERHGRSERHFNLRRKKEDPFVRTCPGFAHSSFWQEWNENASENDARMVFKDEGYSELYLKIQFIPRSKHTRLGYESW